MNIGRLAGVVRRHWLLIVLLTGATMGAAAWLAFTAPSLYRASALLQVQAPADASGAISLNGTLSARERAVTIAALGNTDAVRLRARDAMAKVRGVSGCAVDPRGQSEFLVATCTGTSAHGVAVAANARAAALQAELDAQRKARVTDLIAAYTQQIKTLRMQGVPPADFPDPPVYQTYREVQLLDQARPATAPYSPQRTRMLVLAFILAASVACGLAYGYDRLQNRATSPDALARELGEPLLGTIPRIGRKASRTPA